MLNNNWWNAKQDKKRDDRICERWEEVYKAKIKALNDALDKCQRVINERKNKSTKRKKTRIFMDTDLI
jgi:hypothetical protein